MKYFSASLISLALAATSAQSQTIISDSFESGDLSAIHTSGLSWGRTNDTSLVKRDSEMGDMIVYTNNSVVETQAGFDKQWKARHGDVSMRFSYEPGANSWAEQRFALDSAHPEIWISYWLKVPINYKHSSNSPGNSKLFALWMDGYSSKGAGPSVIWEFWHDGAGGSKLAYHYSEGGYQTANSHKQHKPFISYPDDQGRWMQIVMHVEAASKAYANDGVIQLYRRWSNESDFTLFHDDRKADIAPPDDGPHGWKAGYLMGWSNPGYSEHTEWLLDDLKFSRTSLLYVDPADSPSSEPEPESELPPTLESDESDSSCKPPRIPNILTSPGT